MIESGVLDWPGFDFIARRAIYEHGKPVIDLSRDFPVSGSSINRCGLRVRIDVFEVIDTHAEHFAGVLQFGDVPNKSGKAALVESLVSS